MQSPSDVVKTIADLLNIPDKGEQIIAEYTKKMEDTKEKLKHAVGDETVAVVRINVGDKTLALFGLENRYTGSIYKEMGLTPHPFRLDQLSLLQSDHLFVTFDKRHSIREGEEREVLETSEWRSLHTVRNQNVHEVDFFTWMNYGVLSHFQKIEDVLKALL